MEQLCNGDIIIHEKGLNEKNFNDIMELIKICDDHDRKDLNEPKSAAPSRDETCDFFLYKQDSLIGYLAVYPSVSEGEVRITGMVHPSCRRKGIFTKLFKEAKQIFREKNISRIIIINDQISKSGEAFALSKRGKLKYTSYNMAFNKKYNSKETAELDTFIFRAACDEDIKDIVPIGMDAFGTTEDEEREYNENNFKKPNKNVYIAQYNNTPVGIISSVLEPNEAFICDLAVLKNYRRKGLGRKILQETIEKILSSGIEKISLGVDVDNINALSLYEDCGFRIAGAVDFYEVNI